MRKIVKCLKTIFTIILAVLILVTIVNFNAWLNLKSKKTSPQLYEDALKYTVSILAGFINNQNNNLAELANSGAGFVVKKNGKYYIISVEHIIPQESQPFFYAKFFNDKKNYRLNLIGWEKIFDLATFEFAEKEFKPPVAATLGNSNLLKTGDKIFTLGNPLDFKFLWSEGNVMKTRAYLSSRKTGFVLTDAVCNPGNSGGPIINGNGEVIGVAKLIIGTNPICVGIPEAVINKLFYYLINGEMKHGNIGVLVTNSWDIVPELRKELGLRESGESEGVMVLDTIPGLPAAENGLKRGDILLSYGGDLEGINKPIKDASEFLEELNLSFFLGDEITIKFRRENEYLKRKFKLEGLPSSASSTSDADLSVSPQNRQ